MKQHQYTLQALPTGIFVDTARVNLKLSMCFARPAGVKLTGAENEGFSCM